MINKLIKIYKNKGLKKGTHDIIKKIMRDSYKYLTIRVLFPAVYNKNSKKALDEKKIVFVEVREPAISGSFRYIYDSLKNEGVYHISEQYLRTSFTGKREYVRRVIGMLKDIATAKTVFLNDSTNALGHITLRKDTKLIQLWHGCGAFKKFGLATGELKFGESTDEIRKYPYHKGYSLVTVSSPEVEWAYEQSMDIPEESHIVKGIGVSRTDVFFDEGFLRTSCEKVRGIVPEAGDRKIILYAPTFRGRVATAKAPDRLDIEYMRHALEKEYFLLIKHHPFIKEHPEIPKGCEGFARDVSDELDIDCLIAASDVCISDYSSLVFEYSLMDRPMIFFAYDIEDYSDWRGFYYDYDEMTPGPVYTETSELTEYIKSLPDSFEEGDRDAVRAFRQKFMSGCDGHATERILEFMKDS